MSAANPKWFRVNFLILVAMIAIGWLYVGQAWSPSSYGHVLENSGASETGLIWGKPRAIRSDEWSVTTPLTQATVRNGFSRYNETSYYHEDLRINYSMPLHDWGLAFKPSMWLYGWVPAAYAFSFHYWLMFCLFVFGYAHLFKLAGCNETHAFFLALSLYFTGFVQFFWNSNTSLFVFFPWLLVVMACSLKIWIRAMLFYWLAGCWLIGNFYPPLFISLSLVAIFILWAYRPDLLRPASLGVFGLAALAACATSVLYLWDYLSHTITTSYPGQRTSPSGYYPWHLFLTQFWPSALMDTDFNPGVNYTNITGIGVVGLYWTLATLCLIDWSYPKVKALWVDPVWRILSAGLLVPGAWMLAPIPEWLGKVTLLNRVPPERMIYATGLMLVFWTLRVCQQVGWARDGLTKRFFLYCLVALSGGLAYSLWTRSLPGFHMHYSEWLGPFFMGFALWLGYFFSWPVGSTLLGAGLLMNLMVFGRFNPVQSAHPIFDEPHHLVANTLRMHVDSKGVLPVQKDGFIGATLNGMGFKAVAHLNALPPWGIWNDILGSIDPHTKSILNRYAHTRLIPDDHMRLLENDQVGIPAGFFRAQPTLTLTAQIPAHAVTGGGQVEQVESANSNLLIKGWGNWDDFAHHREMLLLSDSWKAAGVQATLFDVERWDRVKTEKESDQLLSGFVIRVKSQDPAVMASKPCIFIRSSPAKVWQIVSTPWSNEACKTVSVP